MSLSYLRYAVDKVISSYQYETNGKNAGDDILLISELELELLPFSAIGLPSRTTSEVVGKKEHQQAKEEQIDALQEHLESRNVELNNKKNSIIFQEEYNVHVDGTHIVVNAEHIDDIFKEAISQLHDYYHDDGKIKDDEEKLIDHTFAILLIQAECYTAWNIRKRLLKTGKLNHMKEMLFTQLLLSKFPKRPQIWFHRLWLIQIFNKLQFNFELESRICFQAADKYKSNYHAWNYRRQILKKVFTTPTKITTIPVENDELCSISSILVNEFHSFMKREMYQVWNWLKLHVRDCSGWSYMLHLIIEYKVDDLGKTLRLQELNHLAEVHEAPFESMSLFRKYYEKFN